ncbi:c-type cytochrome [Aurantimonas coralicida]|uniref:c-type cytochrome n=1 Tax=Aurantimonas coralicida TaxID=182270 RepID=UPI002B1CB138|nr:cytochrome c [Aurantimonas coralicida]
MAVILATGAAATAFVVVAVLAEQRGGEAAARDVRFLGEPVTAEELAVGQDLYAANCASCHGANLEGQADWMRRLETGRMPAPPHDETGHTWHHPDRQLFIITRLGVGGVVPGYESDMPAFKDVLTDVQIRAVLAFIKSTWPEHQRTFQADVTANDDRDP